MGGNPTRSFSRLRSVDKGKLNRGLSFLSQFDARDAKLLSGNKKDNITVIYTPWSNLKKDGSMAVGQVSFKDPRKVGFLGLFCLLVL